MTGENGKKIFLTTGTTYENSIGIMTDRRYAPGYNLVIAPSPEALGSAMEQLQKDHGINLHKTEGTPAEGDNNPYHTKDHNAFEGLNGLYAAAISDNDFLKLVKRKGKQEFVSRDEEKYVVISHHNDFDKHFDPNRPKPWLTNGAAKPQSKIQDNSETMPAKAAERPIGDYIGG